MAGRLVTMGLLTAVLFGLLLMIIQTNQSNFLIHKYFKSDKGPALVAQENVDLGAIPLEELTQCVDYVQNYPCCTSNISRINCCEAPLWNADLRLKGLNYQEPVNIIYIGGHQGSDASIFLKELPVRQISIFEPLPQYVKKLQHKFENNKAVHVYPFGLGGEDRETKITIVDDDTGGASEHLGISGETFFVKIRDIRNPIIAREIGLPSYVDLLQLNCEGCEYEVLESIIQQGWHTNIKTIQIATHKSLALTNLERRYCRITYELAKHHNRTFGSLWAWERWERTY